MEVIKNLVSVVMSNYNTPEAFLRESIESILNQTYKNFEFIIIDDCSTDESLRIIESYSDNRIVVVKNEVNMGITKSLNRGLKMARGEYIARMDADDICYEDRLEHQVNFLKNNPEYIVCGTAVEFIGNKERKIFYRSIPDRESFRIHLLFGNYPNIVHPTAMFNRKLLLKYNIEYNEKYYYAQDYRMWVECSKYGECENIKKVLLKYRVHDQAVSNSKKNIQNNCKIEIIREQLESLNIQLKNEDVDTHVDLLGQRKSYNLKYKKWIKKIIQSNEKYSIYDRKKLKFILWEKWAEITYFELFRNKNVVDIVSIMCHFPLIHINKIIGVYYKRRKKQCY